MKNTKFLKDNPLHFASGHVSVYDTKLGELKGDYSMGIVRASPHSRVLYTKRCLSSLNNDNSNFVDIGIKGDQIKNPQHIKDWLEFAKLCEFDIKYKKKSKYSSHFSKTNIEDIEYHKFRLNNTKNKKTQLPTEIQHLHYKGIVQSNNFMVRMLYSLNFTDIIEKVFRLRDMYPDVDPRVILFIAYVSSPRNGYYSFFYNEDFKSVKYPFISSLTSRYLHTRKYKNLNEIPDVNEMYATRGCFDYKKAKSKNKFIMECDEFVKNFTYRGKNIDELYKYIKNEN